jgi:hypothetical protein
VGEDVYVTVAVGVRVGVNVTVGVGVGVLNQPPRLLSSARKARAMMVRMAIITSIMVFMRIFLWKSTVFSFWRFVGDKSPPQYMKVG